MAPVVQLSSIHKSFGDSHVLRGVDLGLEPGEVVALLGINGAGKSTLTRILAGRLLPTSGICNPTPEEARKLVGLCGADERSFYGRLTARENLLFFGALQSSPPDPQRIDTLLEGLRLSAAAHRRVQTFSSGMLQRLNVARAVLHDPPILVLDEPTKAADPGTADTIRELVRNQWVEKSGKAVLLVTHDLYDLERLADRVLILHGGTITYEGTPQEAQSAHAAGLRGMLRELGEALPA